MNEQLKQFRARWNLTQEDVSVLLGVRQPAWNMWETDKRDVPAYILRSLSFFERIPLQDQQQEIDFARRKA